MSKNNIIYRLPETDSEDYDDDMYDGFMFGDDIKPSRPIIVRHKEQDLYDALMAGNLHAVQYEMDKLKFNVNDVVKDIWPPLHLACSDGHHDIVKYLIDDCKANVNQMVDNCFTPILLACRCANKNIDTMEAIIQLLLEHNAVVNVSDKYGITPFMWACENNYKNAVTLMLNGNVNVEAKDIDGNTAIFYAIEKNRYDIVKLLIEAGVNCFGRNNKGFTTTQVAQFKEYNQLLELLPKEKEIYCPPTSHIYYNTIEDYIPQIFPTNNCPEYFQSIYTILCAINMERTIEYFVKDNTTLSRFLCMDENDLENLGIELPLDRMKIMKGLLDFHLHNWSSKSLACVTKNANENMYDILMIVANQMQHLIILQSTIRYVENNLNNNRFGPLDIECLENLQENLNNYRKSLKNLHKTVNYLATFSPSKNPLFIDEENRKALKQFKKRRFQCFFKYGLVIGFAAMWYLKLKRSF